MIKGAARVLRGGSWNNNIGFRLALAQPNVETAIDQIAIRSAGRLAGGEKQMPRGALVDERSNARRVGDLSGPNS